MGVSDKIGDWNVKSLREELHALECENSGLRARLEDRATELEYLRAEVELKDKKIDDLIERLSKAGIELVRLEREKASSTEEAIKSLKRAGVQSVEINL